MDLKKATNEEINEEIKEESIKRGVDGRRVLRITFDASELSDCCEKCGASVDNKGKYDNEL